MTEPHAMLAWPHDPARCCWLPDGYASSNTDRCDKGPDHPIHHTAAAPTEQATQPAETTTHTATLTIDGEYLRVELTCHGGTFAHCRQTCVEPDCEAESYSGMSLDDEEGWTHLHYSYDDESGEESEVPHRMSGGECMVLLFMEESGYPQECYVGSKTPLRDTPIKYRWDLDHYEWWPADQEEPK